ncbi:hypothetical protein [uncultured Vagococcus sp.]|uniref:hypothetical protein n=1 Tax=uncultured Vagococcus sp. TaxID=189676 RepID=UPI0028D6F0FE|nr:hypothetical protein [uncultured Vagococcus sp.]
MFPIKKLGGFEEVVRQKEGDRDRVVGILLADIEQQDTRDYIMGYIDMLDKISGEDINFYIPGYRKLNNQKKVTSNFIDLDHGLYSFDRKMYNCSLTEIMNNYSVENPATPTLLLLQWTGNGFEADRYISIDLDKGNDSIKYSFVFLSDILNKKDILNNLSLIHDYLDKQRYAKYLREDAINDLGFSGLPVIIRTYDAVKKYFISDPNF